MTGTREFRVAREIHQDFPEVLIGVTRVVGLNNQGEDPELAGQLAAASAAALREIGSTPPGQHPRVACWREAYRRFGVKPKKYQSSIENLLRRVSKSGPPRSINKLVDLYNVVSLRHLVPVGGEDLDQIQGNLVLRYARQSDPEALLLGESTPRQAYPGEVIYCDDGGPVCRRWNWKEAQRTRLREETTSAILVVEALPPVTRLELEAAVRDLEQMIERSCGGEIHSGILDRDHSQWPLSSPAN